MLLYMTLIAIVNSKKMKRLLTLILTVLPTIRTHAQIDENNIFSTWGNPLQQNIVTSDIEEDLIQPKPTEQKDTIHEAGFKTLYLENTKLKIPVNYTDEGVDMFMLTEEGITIHMAALKPVFWQETTPDLVRWIRFYAYSKRSYTEKIFSKYQKWEPYIQACFESYGIPSEIAILCLIESGCKYDAVSPVGATGMWQIMAATGREKGLTIDEYQDDRLDPVLSSAAAAKILSANYAACKDWTLAVAAYNCGTGRVGKCIKQAGVSMWPECKPFMPSETQQYIPALLAIHYVWNYRKELGFNHSGQP